MVLENYPTTKTLNEVWNQKITDSFPMLCRVSDSKYLSLKEYISNRPQKFYSERTYNDYLTFLINLKKKISLLYFYQLTRNLNMKFISLLKRLMISIL